ncbi:MAG: hypothetical protein AAB250_02330, partial [Bdellovibrionota bacterium]
ADAANLPKYPPTTAGGHLWSVAVEEHFYLIAPLSFMIFLKRASPAVRLKRLVGVWFFGLALVFGLHFALGEVDDWVGTFYFPTHVRIGSLTTGMIVALLLTHYSAYWKNIFQRRWIRVVSVAWPVSVFLLLLEPWNTNPLSTSNEFFLFPEGEQLANIFKVGPVVQSAYFCLLMNFLFVDGKVRAFLSRRSFLYMSSLGYAVYLTHIPVLQFIVVPYVLRNGSLQQPGGWWIAFAATCVISYAFAYALHLAVEKPAMTLRDRWYGRSRPI